MQIGFIGLGKLGLPVAVCLAQKHMVVGYDLNPELRKYRQYEHRETGPDGVGEFQRWFNHACCMLGETPFTKDKPYLRFADSVTEAVKGSEIIFVAVQTPHDPRYDGSSRLPEERADFDYTHLVQAVKDVCEHTTPEQVVVVISTVLPGTTRREILPVVNGRAKIVYSPLFIAMGTVMRDFLNPEFVLLGGDDRHACFWVEKFYADFYAPLMAPILSMSLESAELSKVAYNTALTMKIHVANTLMEVCHRVPGCHIDDVTRVLKAAGRRIVSTAYMDGGAEDGGGCHPRDNIAMSWLARTLGLYYDTFGEAMKARQWRTEWVADLVYKELDRTDLPLVILGKAYKPETSLTAGSWALLLAAVLERRGVRFTQYDPWVDPMNATELPYRPSVYLIATRHECFKNYRFAPDSVVLDPFRYIKPQDGVTVVPLGVGPST